MADGPSSSSSFTTALIAGGLAGTAVDTLFFPIDTLKTRAQSSQGFIAAGGFNGVYRGLGSAVVGSAPGGQSHLRPCARSLSILELNPSFVPLSAFQLRPSLRVTRPSKYIYHCCSLRSPEKTWLQLYTCSQPAVVKL